MRIKNASIEIHSLLNDNFPMQTSCSIVRCEYNNIEIQSKTLLSSQLFLCIISRQMEAEYIAKFSIWISIFLPSYFLLLLSLFVNVYKLDVFVFVCVVFYTSRAHRLLLSRALQQYNSLVQYVIELLQKITEQYNVICVILGYIYPATILMLYIPKITERQVSLVLHMLFSKGATIWVH